MALSSATGMMLMSRVPSSTPSFHIHHRHQHQRQQPISTTTMRIECSSRPQKKATAHHRKARPKKTQPWDVNRRGPTPYPPLPSLPPDWTLVSSSPASDLLSQQMVDDEAAVAAVEAEVVVA